MGVAKAPEIEVVFTEHDARVIAANPHLARAASLLKEAIAAFSDAGIIICILPDALAQLEESEVGH